MNNDRELLQAAAKAAGIVMDSQTDTWYQTGGGWCRAEWNPLTDDGDALRLAVKLNLWAAVRDGYQHLDSDNDFYAATRRAIVRAAAAIGKDMP